jgi:hypothetical protein
LRLEPVIREQNALQRAGVALVNADGRRIAELVIVGGSWIKVTDDWVKDVADQVIAALQADGIIVPDEEYRPQPPSWAEIGTRVVTGGGSRGAPGEIRIPPGAKFEANGEIHVPPRSDDSKHPDNKSFRRACRKARNQIRELAEKSGKTVEFIMAELMEGKK